jgi:hypothetical protein
MRDAAVPPPAIEVSIEHVRRCVHTVTRARLGARRKAGCAASEASGHTQNAAWASLLSLSVLTSSSLSLRSLLTMASPARSNYVNAVVGCA